MGSSVTRLTSDSDSFFSTDSNSESEMNPEHRSKLFLELQQRMRRSPRPPVAPPPPPRRSVSVLPSVPSTSGPPAPTCARSQSLTEEKCLSTAQGQFEEILNAMKSDLRQKYINEIDAIQRSTATDPDTWANLEPTMAQIAKLNQFLEKIDSLKLDDDSPGASNTRDDLATEISCPICFEEMVNPKLILCCSNGHAICSECDSKVKYCPVCRESFEKKGRPQRNKFAERLIAVYLESIKK